MNRLHSGGIIADAAEGLGERVRPKNTFIIILFIVIIILAVSNYYSNEAEYEEN